MLADEADQLGVDDGGAALPGGQLARLVALLPGVRGGAQREEVEHPVADQHVLPQRDRPHLADDDRRVPADGDQPLAELLGVADRRRQRDQGDRLREVDDHLFPDRAAEPVGEVVHLVHDHVAEAVDRRGLGVEHVAQHLGGHHDHGGVAVDGVVAGEQADLLGAVALDEVGVLLVRQRLDRRRVERLAPLGQGLVDGELAHDRLARAGGRADEDAGALLQRLAGLDLERVQGEAEVGGEVRQRGMGGPPPGSGVPLSGAGHAPTLGARAIDRLIGAPPDAVSRSGRGPCPTGGGSGATGPDDPQGAGNALGDRGQRRDELAVGVGRDARRAQLDPRGTVHRDQRVLDVRAQRSAAAWCGSAPAGWSPRRP